MNLTREQAIAEHRKMWGWIADMTEKLKRKVEKEEYFREMGTSDIPRMQCYCCEFSIYYPIGCEEHCIINWGGNRGCMNSYFEKWLFTYNWKEAARLARIIANLQERKIDGN